MVTPTPEPREDHTSAFCHSASVKEFSAETSITSLDSSPDVHRYLQVESVTVSAQFSTGRAHLAAALSLPQRTGIPIPKPHGEAAHPNKGGYSLERTLVDIHRWSKPGYDVINGQTKGLTSSILDTTKNYRDQDESAKDHICDLLVNDFPFLADYVNCWPIRDMIKAHLKYRRTKRRARS
ncbi:hypothetical protein VNI00_016129 [Paramarasmius palmivorus]|uniref:Uncharacterized protein n=1 Tax=Paramarasmius palmivorus TaxID=297713 RepID=A0AAW0BFH4_9AGAR